MNQETEEPAPEIPEEPFAIRLAADHLENRIRELQAAIDRDDEPATRMAEGTCPGRGEGVLAGGRR